MKFSLDNKYCDITKVFKKYLKVILEHLDSLPKYDGVGARPKHHKPKYYGVSYDPSDWIVSIGAIYDNDMNTDSIDSFKADHDYDWSLKNINVYAPNYTYKDDKVNARLSLFSFDIMRMYNCCGAAVISNVNIGSVFCKNGVSGSVLGMAMELAYVMGYNMALGTCKSRSTRFIKLIERFGWEKDYSWTNKRTDNYLHGYHVNLDNHPRIFSAVNEKNV